jgi:hypothetical protein
MTKKEFEKWKRLTYEKSNEVLSGHISVHIDCPLLTPEEKKFVHNLYYVKNPIIDFRIIGEKLIYSDYLTVNVIGTRNRYHIRQIHRKWIEKIHIFNIYGWKDITGKRDSKLEWIMKNLENDSNSQK